MPIVNGHEAECGCYVEGHWGQYGPDHLAEQAEGFGWEPKQVEINGRFYDDDPRTWRAIAESHDRACDDKDCPFWNPDYPGATAWEYHIEAADDIETWLNSVTSSENEDGDQPGYVWHWRDGEFFLSPICDDPEDCNDDTCAHWD